MAAARRQRRGLAEAPGPAVDQRLGDGSAGSMPKIRRTASCPRPARSTGLKLPRGIRVDSGIEEGGEVSPYYDPMIAKLIVAAPSRPAAAAKLGAGGTPRRGLAGAHQRGLPGPARRATPDFIAGNIDTGFIERHADRLVPAAEPSAARPAGSGARALLPASARPVGRAVRLPRQRRARSARRGGDRRPCPSGRDRRQRGPCARDSLIGGERLLFVDGEAWPIDIPRAGHGRRRRGLRRQPARADAGAR